MGGSQTRPEKGGGVWLERDSEITAHQPIGRPVGQTFAAWQWFGLGARWAALDYQVRNGTKSAGGQSKGPLYKEVKPKFVLILYQNGFSNSYIQHQIFQLFFESQLWWSEFMRCTNSKLSLSFTLNSSYWRPDHLHKCHYLAGLPSILVFTYLHLGFKSKRRLGTSCRFCSFFRSVRTSYVTFDWSVCPQEFLVLLLQFWPKKFRQEMVWNGEKIGQITFLATWPPPLWWWWWWGRGWG